MKEYSAEDYKAVLAWAQWNTGCQNSLAYWEETCVRSDILAEIVPLKAMQKHDGEARLFLTPDTPDRREVFQRVQSLLHIPAHHDIHSITYHPGDLAYYRVSALCEVEPYPSAGAEDMWKERGIVREVRPITITRCHISKRVDKETNG